MFRTSWVYPQEDSCVRSFLYGILACMELTIQKLMIELIYITKLNSILWGRDVTHIYYAVVKSTITYAAETWCLKAKTVAKQNSTGMDF